MSVRGVRPTQLAVAAALAVALAACRDAAPAVPGAPPAVVHRMYELEVAGTALGSGEHGVRAEIVAPSGERVSLPAFPRGSGAAVRFRPEEPGRHSWRMLAGDGTVDREVARGEVRVEELGAPGGVRVRGATLVTERGRPFRPLGEDSLDVGDPAWSDGRALESHVGRMAADGMNALRVRLVTACGRAGAAPDPGCLEPALGRFDEAAAARYDAVLAAAERHGVKVVLSIFAAGTPGDAGKGWEESPYAAARGGPAQAPRDFFTDPVAREAARRRLRYVLARWSASPALLAIDLLDGPERDGAIPEPAWIPWAQDLAQTWREHDPYGHPVTGGSAGLHGRDARAWWASPECDVVEWHPRGPGGDDVHALARALVGTIRDTARAGKPVLVGELGWAGDPAPLHDQTHVGIWAATFAGAGVLARSTPGFTVDSGAPMTPARARHFRALAAFLRRAEARGVLLPAADPAVSPRGARALALAGTRAAAVWIHAPAEGYGSPVRGARVAVAGLAPGRWRVSWVDDVEGADLAHAVVEARGGAVSLDAPPFVRHVAALLERIEGLEGVEQASAGR